MAKGFRISVRKSGGTTVWDCWKAEKTQGPRARKGKGGTAVREERTVRLVSVKHGKRRVMGEI